MIARAYSSDSRYAEFIAAIQSNPGEETIRLAFSDWVEEQGDEGEVLAIQEHRSARVDIFPTALKFVKGLSDALQTRMSSMTSLFAPVLERFREAVVSLTRGLNSDAGRELIVAIPAPYTRQAAEEETSQQKAPSGRRGGRSDPPLFILASVPHHGGRVDGPTFCRTFVGDPNAVAPRDR